MTRISTAIVILCFGCVVVLAQQARYTVQLEALPVLNSALEKVGQLKAQGVDAYIVKSQVLGKGIFYRVRVGEFLTQAQARRFGIDLQGQGIVREFFIAVFERQTVDFEPPAPKIIGVPETTAPLPPAKALSHSYPQISSSSNSSFTATRSVPSTNAREKDRENLSLTKSEAPVINYRGYIRGPRGGCYYINRNGNKTYVDRSLCGIVPSYSSPSSSSRGEYITGPRGGCYYINGNGNKTYVDRSYCK